MRLRAALGILAAAGSAKATDGVAPDAVVTEAVLPDALFPRPRNYWVAGVAIERFASRSDDFAALDHFLLGVTAMWRLGPVAPHAMLMTSPDTQPQNLRLLGGLGVRGYFKIPGFTELSAGAGTHIEARLEDHFWLGYLTPLEVGGVVVSNRSFDMEVFVGVRRVIAGHLINNFLIDPNGFDSEGANDSLDREKGADAWKGFVRIVFGRRLD